MDDCSRDWEGYVAISRAHADQPIASISVGLACLLANNKDVANSCGEARDEDDSDVRSSTSAKAEATC